MCNQLLTFDPSGVNPSDTLRVSEAPLKEARHLLYAGEPVHRNGSLLTFDFRVAVYSPNFELRINYANCP